MSWFYYKCSFFSFPCYSFIFFKASLLEKEVVEVSCVLFLLVRPSMEVVRVLDL